MDQYNTIYDVHTFQILDKPANRATFFQSFSTSPALTVLTMDTFIKHCPIFLFFHPIWSLIWSIQISNPSFWFQKWIYLFWRMIKVLIQFWYCVFLSSFISTKLAKLEKKRSDWIGRNLLLWLADARIQKSFLAAISV